MMVEGKARQLVWGAAAALALFASLSAAQAQQSGATRALPNPVIAVVDFKRAVEESAAGRSVIRQINKRHERIQKEIVKDTAELEKAQQELERQRALLSPEVFKQKWREFQIRVQQYRNSVQTEQKRLDTMMGQAMLEIEAKLADVLRDIANDFGANIVVDAGPGRGNILFSDALLMVTDEAKARLNKVLPDVKVKEPAAGSKAATQTPRLQVPRVK